MAESTPAQQPPPEDQRVFDSAHLLGQGFLTVVHSSVRDFKGMYKNY